MRTLCLSRPLYSLPGDVSATLQAVVDRVRPGGVVAFAEADFTLVLGYTQAGPSELFRQTWAWATQAFRAAGVHTAMAQPLSHAFTAAGLGEPHIELHAPSGVIRSGPATRGSPSRCAACCHSWRRSGL